MGFENVNSLDLKCFRIIRPVKEWCGLSCEVREVQAEVRWYGSVNRCGCRMWLICCVKGG